MVRFGSEFRYGDLPPEDTILAVRQIVGAVAGFLADETRKLRDKDTELEMVICLRFQIDGAPQRVAVMMPDKPEVAVDVMEEMLGAVHQKISEEKP